MCGALLPLLALDCFCNKPHHHRCGCGCGFGERRGPYYESTVEQFGEVLTENAGVYHAHYRENAGGMRFGGVGGCGCRN